MDFTFFGSPKFSEIILRKLIQSGYIPSVLICNPDKPVGRKKIITPPLTKSLVLEKKLDTQIFQPKNKKELSELFIGSKIRTDFGIVAAYSKIIPKDVLDSFHKGVIGVHPSLLPELRGASPIQSAILEGKEETGMTLYLMDEGMDSGAMLASRKLKVESEKKYEELEKELAELAGEMLIEFLPKFIQGEFKTEEQDHLKATFTKKFETQDGFVDLEKDDPISIERKIRALNPDPGVFAFINGKRVKLLEAEKKENEIVITKILPEGKRIQNSKIVLDKSKIES